MQLNHFHPAALLRLDAVEEITSLSRSTIYRYVERGRFPAPVKLGQRCIRWCAGDVIAWLEAMRLNCQPDNSIEQPGAENCQAGKSGKAQMARIASAANHGAPLHPYRLRETLRLPE